MKYTTLLLLSMTLLFLATSCKENLDLDANTLFSVAEVLKSKNCKADCGDNADCEGETAKILGMLDAGNINEDNAQFYLIDFEETDEKLEVKVAESIKTEVFDKIRTRGGESVQVTGELEGFDAATNLNCKRQFFLNVTAAELVEVQ